MREGVGQTYVRTQPLNLIKLNMTVPKVRRKTFLASLGAVALGIIAPTVSSARESITKGATQMAGKRSERVLERDPRAVPSATREL